MIELPFISDGVEFQKELQRLRQIRKQTKRKLKRSYSLSIKARNVILAKTNGKCHICGEFLSTGKFEADHVKSHALSGENIAENFLPACRTCNNYRWHYLPEEMKWIIKLGVWARNEIDKSTKTGKLLSSSYTKHEVIRERRRRIPRLQ